MVVAAETRGAETVGSGGGGEAAASAAPERRRRHTGEAARTHLMESLKKNALLNPSILITGLHESICPGRSTELVVSEHSGNMQPAAASLPTDMQQKVTHATLTERDTGRNTRINYSQPQPHDRHTQGQKKGRKSPQRPPPAAEHYSCSDAR